MHSKVVEALRIGSEAIEFLDSLKCPKAKEIVARWNEARKECPYLSNPDCPCDPCECVSCGCESKGDAE